MELLREALEPPTCVAAIPVFKDRRGLFFFYERFLKREQAKRHGEHLYQSGKAQSFRVVPRAGMWELWTKGLMRTYQT